MGFLDDLSDSERDREELWQENPVWGDSSNLFDVPYDMGSQIRSAPGNVWGGIQAANNAVKPSGPLWDFLQAAATGFPSRRQVGEFRSQVSTS